MADQVQQASERERRIRAATAIEKFLQSDGGKEFTEILEERLKFSTSILLDPQATPLDEVQVGRGFIQGVQWVVDEMYRCLRDYRNEAAERAKRPAVPSEREMEIVRNYLDKGDERTPGGL